jgi:hypothetical protein
VVRSGTAHSDATTDRDDGTGIEPLGHQIAGPNAVLDRLSLRVESAEDQLYPGSNARALTLVQIDNVSTDGAPLLAMQLKSAPQSGIQPQDDGTGHGTH